MGKIAQCVASRVISLQRSQSSIKYDKFLLSLVFAIICCINLGWAQQEHYSKSPSYGGGGRFVDEEEAEIIAKETNMRIAKIPCNFTTKTNCLYVEQLKLTLPTKQEKLRQSNQLNNKEIVVSWVSNAGIILNRTQHKQAGDNNGNNNNNNKREKPQNDFYNFNWIFEVLACMMLASAFEICLLVLRNLRNISLAFFSLWSAVNVRLQKLCYAGAATTPANNTKSEQQQQRKRNVAMGEKRTLSYIFAILTWRASQTAKGATSNTEANLTDENINNAISYGHVTTMGDLLLLILFTHVYYQRHRYHQSDEEHTETDDDECEGDDLGLKKSDKEKDRISSKAYHKFYDKKNNNNNNSNNFNNPNLQRAGCSHYCGNMYQQILTSHINKASQVKLTPPLATYTTKIPYLTYCTTSIVCHTCCFCPYSCLSCCYCCCNYRRWHQRCYIYLPLCNTIYCCCFYKSLKFFQHLNFQYCCCYLCCWPDLCYSSALATHASYCCCCYIYCERLYNCCCLCNVLATKLITGRSANLLLLHKIKNSSSFTVWKFKCNSHQSYSILYKLDGQSYFLLYLMDGRCMFVNKRKYYQIASDVISALWPQYLLSIKNFQTFFKCKKVHVAVMVMALIVICASSAGSSYDHQHYYSSLFNTCNKHFARCKQSKRSRRRQRRRHQHCKDYRPQHYFFCYTTLIQCVKRQKKAKKLHKKQTQTNKLLTPPTMTITTYECSLALNSTKAPMMVRAIWRVRGAKPNIIWLVIGLIWFEGPKIVNCNVIINYQNQQQQQQQHEQQHQPHQQTGNSQKETTTNSINSNFEYKMENYNQMKTKSSNNNSNSNNNNNNSSNNNKNKNKNSSNNNNSNSNSNNTSNRTSNTTTTSSNNIQLSVNFIPIINTLHFKHYCNSNYHQKLIRSTQRVQRALKTKPNLVTSITASASHNYNNINDDLYSQPMASSSAFENLNEESHAQSDLMRLESIKHQILFKLGLTRKPNVSHPLPKQFIWDTIYRADGIKSFHEFSSTNNFQDHLHFMPQKHYHPYWSGKPENGGAANVVSVQQHQQHRAAHSKEAAEDLEDGIDNIKRSLESNNVKRKKYNKNKQQQNAPLPKHYSNVINYNNDNNNQQKGPTAKNFNQQLSYTTSTTTITNRNKLINHTNKTVNNLTILKQTKHQQFHKNSQHSTTTTAKKTIHQQQNRRQHEPIIQNTNNNSNKNNFQNNKISNNNNNKTNNVNVNNNNSNNNNNIIMVQTHLRNNNNKYIEEAKKFTYLTDINSSDDSLNSMEYHNLNDFEDNNSIAVVRRKQKPHNIRNEKISENNHHLNIATNNGDEGVNSNSDIIQHIANDNNVNKNDDDDDDDGDDGDDDGDRYHQQQHQRHENYSPKLNSFDENDDFFGSTQEIITFAEKGKMYKNHRLVEFSHQNNAKPKQKLHVRNAEIHIRIDKISINNKSRAGSGIKRKRLKIWIFQLIENNYTYKGFDHVAQFCASFEVDTSRLGWKKFDITTTVKEWYSRREGEKLRLLIDCTGCGKMYAVHLFNGNTAKAADSSSVREQRRIADEGLNANMNEINGKDFYNVSQNDENYTNFPYNHTIVETAKTPGKPHDDDELQNSSRPFLVLHTEARRQRRVRRRAINCNGALHGQCCKESFYVSFKALGWDDWIIAPRGYFANYCRGDCTGPYRTPDTFQTFHAHFIEEYRKMGLLNGMQPCCAPIKFSSMSLIYYGDEGIIKRDLPKMVVDECGCP